ncbi:unnamed protein product, partial [Iphiclides podalirius]
MRWRQLGKLLEHSVLIISADGLALSARQSGRDQFDGRGVNKQGAIRRGRRTREAGTCADLMCTYRLTDSAACAEIVHEFAI